MANTYEKQFLYSKYGNLTLRSGTVTIGGSGSVASASGPGLLTVTKAATGVYQLKFKDNFYGFVSASAQMMAGTAGAVVGDGTFTANTLYQIVTVGNTNWTAAGFDGDYTPAVGAVFVASGTGSGTGTGQVKAITPTTIDMVEVVQSPQTQLQNKSGTKGASVFLQTVGSTGPGTTTLVAINPAAGSQIVYNVWFVNTSVTPF